MMKHLALNLELADLHQFLEAREAVPLNLEFLYTATHSFRTALLHYQSPAMTRDAMQRLGTSPEFCGSRARVEFQRSKPSSGSHFLQAQMSHEALEVVQAEITDFINDPESLERRLPVTFTCLQRKFAHSLAERHGLAHGTRQGDGEEKYVLLSKSRPSVCQRPGKLPTEAVCHNLSWALLFTSSPRLRPPPGLELQCLPLHKPSFERAMCFSD